VRIDYPRAGRQGVRRFVPSWRLLLGLSGIGVVFVVGLFALGYALVKVPSPSSISLAQSASVFYSDGTTPLGHVGARNRESVQLSQVPISVQNAVLAAEDRNFYSEQAVSPTGILRAVLVDLKDRDFVEGGSTITQQYVKNAYLTQQRTLTRKFKEFFIAIKIGRTHKKPEILQDYLNTIYFGRGAYGIQAASQAFFGKDVSKLTTEEGAVLASSIQAPSYLDPALHLSAAEFRWNYVLDGMVKKGWLTPAARAAAKYPTDIESAAATSDLTGSNGYLLATVETELESHGISENQINRGGLKIVTTFDQPTQQAALAAVDKVVGNGRVPADVKTALIAVQPGTGKVLAMYGGSDYLTQPFNEATQSIPPMGSTFKAYVLAAALKSGIPLTKTFSGKSPQTIDGQVYHNDSNESFGQVNLVAATAQSVNTVFVNLGETVGVDKVAAAAYAAGLPSSVALSKNGSMMLGSDSAHPIDAAAAYATFAAGGKYVQPYVVQSVTDSSGHSLYSAKPPSRNAFSTAVASGVTYALQDVITQGTGKSAAIGRPAAGKTGTTSGNVSAWFVGYTPQISTAVAMFRDANAPLQNIAGYSQIYGGTLPALMWSAFMKAALVHTKVVPFPAVQLAPTPSVKPSSSAPPSPSVTSPPASTPPASTPAPVVSSPVASVPTSSVAPSSATPSATPTPTSPPATPPASPPASAVESGAVLVRPNATPAPG
jgi:membrane peptidoglycan carboxypeptidase